MKKALVTLLCAFALFCSQAAAQTVSDMGTWSSIQLVKSFGAPYAMARVELRGQYRAPESIFTPYLMYEFFSSFDSMLWVRSLHYAGTEISLGKGHGLDFFYMYHLYDKGGQTAACHLLGIGYNFVF